MRRRSRKARRRRDRFIRSAMSLGASKKVAKAAYRLWRVISEWMNILVRAMNAFAKSLSRLDCPEIRKFFTITETEGTEQCEIPTEVVLLPAATITEG